MRWDVQIGGGTKLCATDVDERHLDPVWAGRIPVFSERAVELRGGQQEDRPEALERRPTGKDRMLSSVPDLQGHEPASDVRRLVVALVRVHPAPGDERLARLCQSFTALQFILQELLLEVLQLEAAGRMYQILWH